MNRRTTFSQCLTAAGVLFGAVVSAPSLAADKFVYGLSWHPQMEHCGWFQAKATGLYEKAGLEVELYPGGPGVNMAQLVAAGKVDAGMGTALTSLNMRNSGIPGVTVAAMLQKTPQTLVAHADPTLKTLEDLKTRKISVANFSRQQFWLFLKSKYGFDDTQLRPYTYNPSMFVADKAMVQQGYITEDEFFLGKALGSEIKTFLMADYGWPDYASTIFTTEAVTQGRRGVLQKFVDATITGWAQCINGNARPAMEAIRAAASEQSFELSEFKLSQMKKYALITGGDAAMSGIGAMSEARWKSIFDMMAEGGVYPKDLDYKKAYTLDFVNKKVGM